MRPVSSLAIACGIVLLAASSSFAQDAADYPPASGHMTVIPPSLPAPGGVGGDYVETFPAHGQVYEPAPPVAQQVVPGPTPTAPRVRGRLQRGARIYSRGYSQAPAPYATRLPQGQLYWPGSSLSPGYTPYSRYQTYGQGYMQSPYGSNFWGGYYKGFSLGY
jgi:hypothetical protein